MNTEKIYNMLKDGRTEEVLRLLEEDMAINAMSGSSKKRLASCLSYHKKMLKQPKIVLAYTKMLDDGRQAFCDSYFLVRLVKEDFTTIPEVPEKLNYPELKTVVNRGGETYKVALKDLLIACKQSDIVKISDRYFKSDNMKHLISFLNYNDEYVTFTIHEGINSFAFVKKDNGSEGCICPMHIEDNDTEYAEVKVQE